MGGQFGQRIEVEEEREREREKEERGVGEVLSSLVLYVILGACVEFRPGKLSFG